MTYTKPIKFNKNPITSSRSLRKFGRNVFFSLGVPVVFSIIAVVLSRIAEDTLFDTGDTMGTLNLFMDFIKTMVTTLVAALALNSNLNSGRMDFSLGATGILGALLASLVVPSIDSLQHMFLFIVLTIIFAMILGFLHSLIFIFLKLPPIVTSLGMCLVYEGIAKVIAGNNNTIIIKTVVSFSNFFKEPIIIIPILLIVMLVMSFAFCYTKFGYNKNALVYDQKISVDTGINEVKNCIVCFCLAGALIGLFTVLDIAGMQNITIKTDLGSSSTVFRNFLPIFIGGILAKYNNQIVGLTLAVFSTTILTTGMDTCSAIGLDGNMVSLINGLMVFAVLVYMVDKNRFINWVKMQRYLAKERYLNPKGMGGKK